MTSRKLFVSHSSKTPENIALLEGLCQALGAGGLGFDVLVDQGGGIPTGPLLPADIEQAIGVRPLLPALDPDLEARQPGDYDDTVDFIRNRFPDQGIPHPLS